MFSQRPRVAAPSNRPHGPLDDGDLLPLHRSVTTYDAIRSLALCSANPNSIEPSSNSTARTSFSTEFSVRHPPSMRRLRGPSGGQMCVLPHRFCTVPSTSMCADLRVLWICCDMISGKNDRIELYIRAIDGRSRPESQVLSSRMEHLVRLEPGTTVHNFLYWTRVIAF